MGGYGGYVWSAFALTVLVLVGNVLAARAALARAREIARRARADAA